MLVFCGLGVVLLNLVLWSEPALFEHPAFYELWKAHLRLRTYEKQACPDRLLAGLYQPQRFTVLNIWL